MVREKDGLLEKKVEENCNLKLIIDQQKAEVDKLRKRGEQMQDLAESKEYENKQLKEEVKQLQRKRGNEGEVELLKDKLRRAE